MKAIRLVLIGLIIALSFSVLSQGNSLYSEEWQQEIVTDLVEQNPNVAQVLIQFTYPFLAQTPRELEARQALMARYLEEEEIEFPAQDASYASPSEVDAALDSGELVEVEGLTIADLPLTVSSEVAPEVETLIVQMREQDLDGVFWVTSSVRSEPQNQLLCALGYPVATTTCSEGANPNTAGAGFSLALNNANESYQRYLDEMDTDACEAAAAEIESAEVQPIPTAGWLIEQGCITDPSFISAYEFLQASEEFDVLDLTWAYSVGFLPSGRYYLREPYNAVVSVFYNPELSTN